MATTLAATSAATRVFYEVKGANGKIIYDEDALQRKSPQGSIPLTLAQLETAVKVKGMQAIAKSNPNMAFGWITKTNIAKYIAQFTPTAMV